MTEERHPAATPRDTLPPNKYSGAYILSQLLTLPIDSFKMLESTRNEITKIYSYKGKYFVVPQQCEACPSGYRWDKIGTKYGRQAFQSK